MKKQSIFTKLMTVLFRPFTSANSIKGGAGVRRETGQQGGWGSGFKDDFNKIAR